MLTIKPVCENCGRLLPNESKDAMICTFECTFCKDCVHNILKDVCPNCGGGFEKRPHRPTMCKTKFCVANYPVSKKQYIKPVSLDSYKILQDHFINISPELR